MATASQVIKICNNVMLLHLESEPMSAGADLSAPATLIEQTFAAQFDLEARRVLASWNWNCIRLRELLTLTALDANSIYAKDWSYSGALPGKRIALWEIKMGSSFCSNDKYLIESGAIYTHEEEVQIAYGWYPRCQDYGDGSAFSAAYNTAMGAYLDSLYPALRRYLELEMAWSIAPLLAKTESKRKELYEAIHGQRRGPGGARAEAITANERECASGTINAYGIKNSEEWRSMR
jgi:hypothetical protein